MLQFTTPILKFGSQGEKTGWSYLLIPASLAQQLKPGNKKAFRVKGFLDAYAFEAISLLPMGGGDFILALKADVRKAIRKQKGDKVRVQLEVDAKPLPRPAELLECMADEPAALKAFSKLAPSHQNYYARWISEAKTEATKAKRIALTIEAMLRNQSFSEMIRAQKIVK